MKEAIKYSETVFVVKGLLEKKQCQELIEMGEKIGFADAPITTAMGPIMSKGIRNNTRVILDSKELAEKIWQTTKDYVPKSLFDRSVVGLNERFRFYRYEKGERFKWHFDGFYERENGERSELTLIFYLNENFEGGSTDFRGFSVIPEEGDALIFVHDQLHEGAAVLSGCKYVLRTDIMYSPVLPEIEA